MRMAPSGTDLREHAVDLGDDLDGGAAGGQLVGIHTRDSSSLRSREDHPGLRDRQAVRHQDQLSGCCGGTVVRVERVVADMVLGVAIINDLAHVRRCQA